MPERGEQFVQVAHRHSEMFGDYRRCHIRIGAMPNHIMLHQLEMAISQRVGTPSAQTQLKQLHKIVAAALRCLTAQDIVDTVE